MNIEMIAHVLQSLESELGQGKKYSPEQTQKIRAALMSESEKALSAAFDWWILNANYLPTPQKLIESVRTEAAKNREKSWAQEKRVEQASTPLAGTTPFSKETGKIIHQFYPTADKYGRVPLVNYAAIIEDARSMATKYPGSDWCNIFSDWQEQWAEEGKLDPF